MEPRARRLRDPRPQNLPPDLELSAPFQRVQVLHTGGAEEAWITPRFDLAILGLRRRLEMPPYAPLVIEKIGRHLVSVAHYYCQNGDLVADPDVVFFTGYGPWVPLEITLPPPGGCRVCARVSPDGAEIAQVDVRGQAELVRFVEEFWAHNLGGQGGRTREGWGRGEGVHSPIRCQRCGGPRARRGKPWGHGGKRRRAMGKPGASPSG